MAVIVALALVGFTLVGGLVWQSWSERRDARRFVPPGCRVRDVHVHCSGSGQPSVVLEAGVAASSIGWALVQPELASFCRVCAHDRPGLGYSPPWNQPHTVDQYIAELREVIQYAGAPVILVGHSFGALLAQLYAARHREDLLGLVLLDPALTLEWADPTPGRRAMLGRGIRFSRRGAFLARLGFVRFALLCLTSGARSVSRLMARMSTSGRASSTLDSLVGQVRKLPPEVWPVIQSHWCRASAFRSMADHLAALPDVAAEVHRNRPLPADLPVTVISGSHLSPEQLAEHAAIAGASRFGVHRIAEGSGHWVHVDRPDLVIAAVRDMANT